MERKTSSKTGNKREGPHNEQDLTVRRSGRLVKYISDGRDLELDQPSSSSETQTIKRSRLEDESTVRRSKRLRRLGDHAPVSEIMSQNSTNKKIDPFKTSLGRPNLQTIGRTRRLCNKRCKNELRTTNDKAPNISSTKKTAYVNRKKKICKTANDRQKTSKSASPVKKSNSRPLVPVITKNSKNQVLKKKHGTVNMPKGNQNKTCKTKQKTPSDTLQQPLGSDRTDEDNDQNHEVVLDSGSSEVGASNKSEKTRYGISTDKPGENMVNRNKPDQVTSLIQCINNGNVSQLMTSLNQGSDANERDSDKTSALMYAINRGEPTYVEILLKSKARIGGQNKNGESAFSLACKTDKILCFKLLLSARQMAGSINKQEMRDCLHTAVTNGSAKIAQHLLEKGWCRKGTVAICLYEAITANQPKLVECLARHIGATDLNTTLYMECRPLQWALEKNNPDTVPGLVANGAEVTPGMLYDACARGRTEICRAFVSHCEDVNCYGSSVHWRTGLQVALLNNRKEIVEMLLDAGVDVERPDSTGRTVFMYTCMTNDDPLKDDFREILYSMGCNINHQDQRSNTALMYIIEDNNMRLVRDLLQHGADLESIDRWNNTALSLAAKDNKADIVQLLIDHGANLNHVNMSGHTPLMLAAMSVNDNTGQSLSLLIKAGASLNYQNVLTGRTALMEACFAMNLDCFQLLLDAGADITLECSDGHTALSYCLQRYHHCSRHYVTPTLSTKKKFVELLLDQDVSIGRDLHLMILYGDKSLLQLAFQLKCQISPSLELLPRRLLPRDLGLFPHEPVTPLRCALMRPSLGLAHSLVASCFLHSSDLTMASPETTETNRPGLEDVAQTELGQNGCAQPWSLLSLSFVHVSTALGFGPSRVDRVRRTSLPNRLKRWLMFDQQWKQSMCCGW